MSESKTLPRPRQVTTAAIMGAVGSVLLVVSLFDLMSGLQSIEAREQIAEKLASPTYRGLDVDADFVTGVLRTLLLVNGAVAAAAVVFAVYVFQRHRGARLGFGIAAGLLFFGMFVLADWIPGVPFGIAVVLAFSAALLWSPPVRDWYAGRAPAPPPERPERSSGPAPTAAWPPPQVESQRPEESAEPSPGQSPEKLPGQSPEPPPSSYPFGQQRPVGVLAPPASAGATPDPHRRPGAVTAAVVMTWLLTPLVAFTFGLVVLMLLVARDTLLEAIRQAPELESSGYTTNELMAGLWVASALVLFWCLVACVLAFLTFRRQAWARGLLVGSAATAAMVSLLAFPLGLLVAIPAAASAGLLLSGSARAWFAGQPGNVPGPPPPPPGAGGPPPPSYPQQPPPPPQGKPPVW